MFTTEEVTVSDSLYMQLHKLSAAANSEEEVEHILTTLWRTRITGLSSLDKSRFQSLLNLTSLPQLDPVLASLRSLIRKCVHENSSGDDLLKLFPPDLSPDLQNTLISVLKSIRISGSRNYRHNRSELIYRHLSHPLRFQMGSFGPVKMIVMGVLGLALQSFQIPLPRILLLFPSNTMLFLPTTSLMCLASSQSHGPQRATTLNQLMTLPSSLSRLGPLVGQLKRSKSSKTTSCEFSKVEQLSCVAADMHISTVIYPPMHTCGKLAKDYRQVVWQQRSLGHPVLYPSRCSILVLKMKMQEHRMAS